MPRDGALTLSDVRDPALSIVCEPCAELMMLSASWNGMAAPSSLACRRRQALSGGVPATFTTAEIAELLVARHCQRFGACNLPIDCPGQPPSGEVPFDASGRAFRPPIF